MKLSYVVGGLLVAVGPGLCDDSRGGQGGLLSDLEIEISSGRAGSLWDGLPVNARLRFISLTWRSMNGCDVDASYVVKVTGGPRRGLIGLV